MGFLNHDLKHWKAITLLVKAETIDSIVRRHGGPPIPEERLAYAAIVQERERRGQYKVLPYYKERLNKVYQPIRGEYPAWSEGRT